MKKFNLKFLVVAATTTLLAACAKDDGLSSVTFEEVKSWEPKAVTFDTYMGDAANTRAGYAGSIALAQLKDANAANGFGVFGYLTATEYHNTSNEQATPAAVSSHAAASTPDFMYNQQVSWNSTSNKWNYSPLKYWPNEFASGNIDTQPATATGDYKKYVSFFAYAPYVATPSGSTGITALSANNVSGNPKVTYSLDPKNSVDLLWGTLNGTTQNVLSEGNAGGYVLYNDGTDKNGLAKVNINLTKQKTDGTVGFDFKHTLARVAGVGGLTIIADHESAVGASSEIGAATRITVNSIKISHGNALMRKTGTFDLATGRWTITDAGTANLTIVHDITTANDDANNGNWKLNTAIAEPASFTVDNTGWTSMVDGVLSSAPTEVYNSDEATVHPLLFFEGDQPSLTFEIDYFVRTADPNLKDYYSQVRQKITKTVTFGSAVERGKKYTIAIHLGMTSVSFTANVSDWDTTSAGNPIDPVDVHLPLNVTTP